MKLTLFLIKISDLDNEKLNLSVKIIIKSLYEYKHNKIGVNFNLFLRKMLNYKFDPYVLRMLEISHVIKLHK